MKAKQYGMSQMRSESSRTCIQAISSNVLFVGWCSKANNFRRLFPVADTYQGARGPYPQQPIVSMASKWDILAPKKTTV